ncbi:hypothetical protein R2Q26_14280 [Nitrosomonas sp. Is37]|nr:hypothetical protein [Nitrosomonas sp. Is37]
MPIYGLLYGMSRYVERNRVRVEMVTKVEDYYWSARLAEGGD